MQSRVDKPEAAFYSSYSLVATLIDTRLLVFPNTHFPTSLFNSTVLDNSIWVETMERASELDLVDDLFSGSSTRS
ncbi:hypothetical protein FVER53590_29938 [Fusarium verticillioides]|nr:hypothetical protein FVER53263_20837 [Fusarium verticillioides]RBR04409.1 hypothetical protein FVER53590_29938 [Fusarium verticillioides]